MNGKQYFNQTTVIGLQRIASKILMLFYWMLITALFSLQEIGIIAILALVVSIGEPVSLVRVYTYAEYQISHSLGEGRWDVINGVIVKTVMISLAIAGAIGIAFFLVARSIVGFLQISAEYILLLQLTGVALVVSPLSLLGQSYLSGLLRGKAMAIMTFIQPLTLFISGFILFPLTRLIGLPIAWIISSLSPFLVALYFIRDVFDYPRTAPSLKEILAFTLPLCGAGIVSFFASRTDQVLVIGFLGIELFGLYYLLLEAIMVLRYLSSTILKLFFPTMCESLELGRERAQTVFSKLVKFAFALVIPLFVFAAIVGFPFLSLVFFGKVAGGQVLFTLLCMSSVLIIFKRVIESVLLADGHIRVPLQLAVVSLVAKLTIFPALLLLFPVLEIVGVAFILEFLLIDLCIYIIFKRKPVLTIPLVAGSKIILVCGMSALLLFVLSLVFTNLVFMIVELVGVTLLYLVLLSITKTLTSDDFVLLKTATPQSLHRLINLFHVLNKLSG